MVQEVIPVTLAPHAALTMRVFEYLRAYDLPEPLAQAWAEQIMQTNGTATEAGLQSLLAAAQRRMDDWLAENLGVAREDEQALLTARASLPYWRARNAGGALRACCLPATPPPAELDMPTQVIPLRSMGGLIDTACRECLPLGKRLVRRLHSWLRSI